jgi:hypothetical protein
MVFIQHKDEDIAKLKEIIKLIEEYGTKKLNDVVKELSVLICQINYSYNEECIRNKYGYIRQNNQNVVNENGIYFERLVSLKTIFDKKSITDSNINWSDFLAKLKNKIIFIIEENEVEFNKIDLKSAWD